MVRALANAIPFALAFAFAIAGGGGAAGTAGGTAGGIACDTGTGCPSAPMRGKAERRLLSLKYHPGRRLLRQSAKASDK